MPATTNVNMLTVVHAGSTGMSMSFPDVCKTPMPGGPIPIPYPNLSQSADTSEGSKTVKVDGNSVMLKNSKFSKSSGDEAGTAMGVMSNTNRGGAKYLVTSFDVKIDGQTVGRLTDPMETNLGASSNALCPCELQAPIPQLPDMSDECAKLKDQEKNGEKVASKKSGMLKKHFELMKQIAEEHQVVLYIRQTSPLCGEWIKRHHQPKPHAIFKGNTITDDKGRLEKVQAWLNQQKRWISARVTQAKLLKRNDWYSSLAESFIGVIGANLPQDLVEPLKAMKPFRQDSPCDYENSWITADYDLYQVLVSTEKCVPLGEGTPPFSKLKVAINKSLKWDAIQHGPQAQWIAKPEDVKLGAPEGVNFPAKMSKGFKNENPKELVPIPNRKGMKVFDDNVTVIAPGGTLYLEEQEDTFNALKCRECK